MCTSITLKITNKVVLLRVVKHRNNTEKINLNFCNSYAKPKNGAPVQIMLDMYKMLLYATCNFSLNSLIFN